MKRVLLFLATNFAILMVASVTLRLLGIEPWLDANGINFTSLLVFGAVLGFGGAFVSLAISKWTAKRMMGVQVIENPRNADEAWLVETVRRLAGQAGIGMPEVGYFNSPAPNAFATGARRDKSLVAVSTGLLQRMSRSEVEAVLGHEVSHVANGDMVTLTLIQGVVNTFVFVASRLIGNVVDRVVFRNENGHGPAFWITTIVAELVLAFLATMIVMWFSRQREFRADAGGARLAGRQNMIGALQALGRGHADALPEKMAAFGISGRKGEGLRRLFTSHPPIEERVAALQAATIA
jgi:heat shock protein HtpX